MKKYKSVKECYKNPSTNKLIVEENILRYLDKLGTTDTYYIDSYNSQFFTACYKIPRWRAQEIAQKKHANHHLCRLLRDFPNDEFVSVRETYANFYYFREE